MTTTTEAAFYAVTLNAADSSCGGSCPAPLASASMRELRSKGTSFLRRHASQHGLPNASRKLTSVVLSDIAAHYLAAHKVELAQDDDDEDRMTIEAKVQPPPPHPPSQLQPLPLVSPNNQRHRIISSAGGDNVSVVETVALESEQPSSAFALQPSPSWSQQQQPLSNHFMSAPSFQPLVEPYRNPAVAVAATVLTATLRTSSPSSPCSAPLLVRTLHEMNRLSTTVLRPEASVHKVANASRKCKKQVVEELWSHYALHHARALERSDGGASACVGNVVDDEDDNNAAAAATIIIS